MKKVLAIVLTLVAIFTLSIPTFAAEPRYAGDTVSFYGANGQVEAWTDGSTKHGMATTHLAGASVKAQVSMAKLSTGATLASSPTVTATTDACANVSASNQSVRVYGAHQALVGGVWRGEYTSAADYA